MWLTDLSEGLVLLNLQKIWLFNHRLIIWSAKYCGKKVVALIIIFCVKNKPAFQSIKKKQQLASVHLGMLMLRVSPLSTKKILILSKLLTPQNFTGSAHPCCFSSTTVALHQRPKTHFAKIMESGWVQSNRRRATKRKVLWWVNVSGLQCNIRCI